jgi:carbon monoxide dehydrogenase subunit G
MMRIVLAMFWLSAAVATSSHAADAVDAPIDVHVAKVDETVRVRVSFVVAATLDQAWNVLTDYANMSKFISTLDSSDVLSRHGDTLEVAQKGQVSQGPLKIAFDNVREVVLMPKHEIRSRMIRGEMKSSVFVTYVAAEGNGTRVINEGEFIPNVWLPPVVGPNMVEAATRKQWQQIRAEIVKRAHGSAPAQ